MEWITYGLYDGRFPKSGEEFSEEKRERRREGSGRAGSVQMGKAEKWNWMDFDGLCVEGVK